MECAASSLDHDIVWPSQNPQHEWLSERNVQPASQGPPRKGLTIGTLGCWTAYEEVIGFYISINEVLLVDRLHAGKLGGGG